MAETWVINESPNAPYDDIENSINFVSNGENFEVIFLPSGIMWSNAGLGYGGTAVYTPNNGWTNESYRTITFYDSLEDYEDLLTWLQANAVKQATDKTLDLRTITLTPGEHNFQVQLKGTRPDSELSNTITVDKLTDPVAELNSTLVEWDGDTKADSFDVYVDDVKRGTVDVNVMAMPTNVAVDSMDVASLDSDVRAETYEAFIDGDSIGEISISRIASPTIVNADVNFATVTHDATTNKVEAFIDGVSIGTQYV